MTLPPNEAPAVEEVVERLTARRTSDDCPFETHCYCDVEPPHGELVNPDGPVAASLIASLQAELYLANNERENLKDALDREVGNGEKEAMRAEAAEAERDALRTRVERLEARLEIDHCFKMVNGELVRHEIPPEERDKFPDAVSARDATIALLEEKIRALKGDG